ncbi:conserved repeat protein [Candidatus Nitrososphaera evergladensis SR1]|uniref:Conserved repeat protein n=2 Tax=Nitrososphaera TaxID=497726 RepID=A0A075MRQ7_9ARCH|nr:conserved repeat protein [Candidatus Nitrososphaera evergladensis SR1]
MTIMTTMILLVCVPAFAQEESGQAAELSLERQVQSQGLFPAAGDYVRYDVTIRNTGPSAIEGRSLWVDFVPMRGGHEGSSAKFEVPLLAPGASAQLHLGPFKLHDAGEYALYVGINRGGDATSPDDLALNTQPDVPLDSVTALDPITAMALPAGMGIAAAGVALLAWLFYARKRRG